MEDRNLFTVLFNIAIMFVLLLLILFSGVGISVLIVYVFLAVLIYTAYRIVVGFMS